MVPTALLPLRRNACCWLYRSCPDLNPGTLAPTASTATSLYQDGCSIMDSIDVNSRYISDALHPLLQSPILYFTVTSRLSETPYLYWILIENISFFFFRFIQALWRVSGFIDQFLQLRNWSKATTGSYRVSLNKHNSALTGELHAPHRTLTTARPNVCICWFYLLSLLTVTLIATGCFRQAKYMHN